MHEQEWLAEQFDTHRDHLRGVAYRLLGSTTEADDAVQEAWLRVSRNDTSDVENVGGWLTTIVSRVCLDMLRSRTARREEALDVAATVREPRADPEHETMLADSIGVALLVVLNTLAPVERTTFVLHDMFGLPFDEIARVVGRTPAATRQIASRARRRVRGPSRVATDASRHRALIDAFLGALRAGDLDALLRVLDPDFVMRADASVAGTASEVRGAEAWAKQAVAFARGLQFVHPIVVDGAPGLVFAPRGRLIRALRFEIVEDRIVAVDVIGDPERLRTLELTAP
ncbi:MAG TPA: sigma-70 family RNA polymerase sigma factor [Gemmatimonadaceae bacterium]|nr:sigma-70 family RNA polymerase sigma factor [Gemmatimonadaceae bacterium]